MRRVLLIAGATVALGACNPEAGDPQKQVGPKPQLPEITEALLPSMNVADAVGWQDGEMPTAAPGF